MGILFSSMKLRSAWLVSCSNTSLQKVKYTAKLPQKRTIYSKRSCVDMTLKSGWVCHLLTKILMMNNRQTDMNN